MITQIELGNIPVEVVLKDIKNIHLSVNPPNGKVRISAPATMKIDAIRVYVVSKLHWIKKQQVKFLGQERDISREYLERESHFVWGKRYLLSVLEWDAAPRIELEHDRLILKTRARSSTLKKRALIEQWYREQVRAASAPLIEKWQRILRVTVNRLFVQQMKTRWGTCNTKRHTIRLNSELAKKPIEFLDYVVLHEMAHLIEPSHNERFKELMTRHMPNWRHYRDELNRLPVPHGVWSSSDG